MRFDNEVGCTGSLEDELREARAEVERLKRFRERMDGAERRTLPLCSDHRDKQKGKSCLACDIERLRAALEELRDNPPFNPLDVSHFAEQTLKGGE